MDRWGRLLRRTRPDVWWYWDIWCKTVPPGQSRRILRWPVRGWHQQTSVNRKQTPLTFFSFTPKPSVIFSCFTDFRSESLFSYLTAPSVTFHLMQTSPAAHAVACQQISICMENMPKVSGRCLNKPTSRTYTALCLNIYTRTWYIFI